MSDEELDVYGDTGIESKNAKIPFFLKVLYITLPLWGFFSLYLYWNGSHGWLDRGYWHELQKAANTLYEKIDFFPKE